MKWHKRTQQQVEKKESIQDTKLAKVVSRKLLDSTLHRNNNTGILGLLILRKPQLDNPEHP